MRAPEGPPSGATLGCFEVGGLVYAIEVSVLREVLRWQPATPLPRAPALIEGVVDLREGIVPVVDLGRVLGRDPVRPGPQARIVVAEVDGMVLGIAVDAAVGILSVDPAALGDPPPLATHAGYDAVRAVVRRPGQAPILLLSVESLLEAVYRSALAQGEAA